MGGPGAILTVMLGLALICALCVLILAWILNRCIVSKAAIAVVMMACAYAVWEALSTLDACNAEPTWVAPAPGDGGDGMMIFPCDGPGGVAAYVFAYFAVPLFLLVSAGLSLWYGRRGSGKTSV